MYNDSPYDIRIGSAFVRASLVLQIVLYAFYLAILGTWHRRVQQAKVASPLSRRYLGALYACGVLILLRCVYRTIEYSKGAEGYLALHEAYYYVFDALVILGMMVLLNVYHPGKYFAEDSSVYLALDGVTEVMGPGWSDERRWYWAVIDPLGLAQYVRADKNEPKFWEAQSVQQTVEMQRDRRNVAA